MSQGGSNKKVANSLVTASFGAVIAVYSAGYVRTQAAAERFASQIAERRVPEPNVPETAAPPSETPSAPSSANSPDTAPRATSKPGVVASNEPQPAATTSPVAASATGIEAPAPSPTQAPVTNPAIASPAVNQVVDLAPVVETKQEAATPAPKWKDGTYTGWGYSRHGDIEAEVVIQGGRIASAVISQCLTRYSCSVIDVLIPQVAKRQSPDVDNVSGATQSADAFYGAVVQALAKAK